MIELPSLIALTWTLLTKSSNAFASNSLISLRECSSVFHSRTNSIVSQLRWWFDEIRLKLSLQHTLSLTFSQNVSTANLNSTMCLLAVMILYSWTIPSKQQTLIMVHLSSTSSMTSSNDSARDNRGFSSRKHLRRYVLSSFNEGIPASMRGATVCMSLPKAILIWSNSYWYVGCRLTRGRQVWSIWIHNKIINWRHLLTIFLEYILTN